MQILRRAIFCIIVLCVFAAPLRSEAQGPLKASQANLDRFFQEGAQAYQRADYRAAAEKWQAALGQARALKNIPYVSQLLMNLGVVYWALGQYEQALIHLEEAAGIYRASGNRQGEAMILNNMGMVYQNKGEYRKALPLYEQSLAIKQALGDRKGEANSLANIGNLYIYLGRYEQALSNFEQALAIVREIGDKQVENVALSGVGWVYFNQGQYRQGLAFYEQALELARKIGDRNGISIALNGISISYTELGRYDEALEFHGQTLAMKRANGDRQGEGTSLNNIGVVYQQLRQYDLARSFYEDALTIRREIGDRQGEAQTLLNIGTVYDDLERYEQALEYHQQALGIFQEIGELQGQGKVLSNLGTTYGKLEQYEPALDYYGQSLALRQEIGDLQGQSIDLINMAMIRKEDEQYEQAAQELRSSLEICSEIGALQFLWMAQAGLALVESKQEKREEAVVLYEQALDTIESLRAGISEGGFRSSFMEDKLFVYDEFISLLQDLHQQYPDKGYERKSFEIFERKQGRVFLEEIGKSGARSFGGVPEELLHQEGELETQLAQTRKQIGELYTEASTAPDRERLEKLRQQEETLKAEQQALEARLQQEHPEYYALKYPQPAGLAELQQAVLQPGELLLVYNVMKERTALWAISSEMMQSYSLPLGERGLLEKIAEARESMRDDWAVSRGLALPDQQDAPQAKESPFPRISHELYQTLIPEAVRLLLLSESEGAHRKLTVIPTGPLYALPFELLLTQPAHDVEQAHYLVEEIPIDYLSSASLLKTLRDIQARQTSSAGLPLLAFAHPVYQDIPAGVLLEQERNSPPGRGEGWVETSGETQTPEPTPNPSQEGSLAGSQRESLFLKRGREGFQVLRAQAYRDLVSDLFAELPETADEARAVADALNVPQEGDALQLRENASRAKVFELQESGALAGYRYLLFAMHGVLPDEVEHVAQSALVLSDDFLTMADVFGLQLNARLVSLSACNTGMGTRVRGEGVMGLTRAFMYAGTPTVAVTLWSVESISAKELDVGFFQQLKQGQSPAEALRTVKIRMLQGEYGETYRFPYYWAPFVIFGDGS